MASVIGGYDYGDITEKGLLGVYRQELEDALGTGWADAIGMRVKSDQETETYRWLGMTPALREWVGDRKEKGINVKSYTLTNVLYEATLAISVDDLRRDKISALRIRIADLARRAAQHWEKLISSAIEDNGLSYDGQNFFDTDHSEGSSGTIINAVAAAQVPALNVATAASATRDEMIDIVVGLVQHQYSFKDDAGEPMNGGAKQFMLMVPPAQYGAAVGAVTDRLTNSGESNTLLGQRFKIDVVVNPRLTSDVIIYLFRTDSAAKPFILQSELDTTASIIGAGSEEEFKHRRWLLGVEAIRTVGVGLYQHALKATLS